ncbi:hypothetical protein [Flavobacterium filum]|uniref:hypothetical protein n=1 Tax=Flavobacterium filum TaxID=370974 RepID=UPI00047B9047|nr:hypothetical protein [Flavobacterium filum]
MTFLLYSHTKGFVRQRGIITSGLNHVVHIIEDSWRTKLTKEYAKEFKSNEKLQTALSIVGEALLETTEYGELLTNVREQ